MRRQARFGPAAAFIDASRKPALKMGLVLLLPPLACWPLTGRMGARTPPRLQGETGRLVPGARGRPQTAPCELRRPGGWAGPSLDQGSGWKRPLPRGEPGSRGHPPPTPFLIRSLCLPFSITHTPPMENCPQGLLPPPTAGEEATVLLALLLQVELVGVASAALEGEALALLGIEGPKGVLAGLSWDDGQAAGGCRQRGRERLPLRVNAGLGGPHETPHPTPAGLAALTLRPAGLQAAALGGKVVLVSPAAAIEESLAVLGCGVVEVAQLHPQAGAGVLGLQAEICGERASPVASRRPASGRGAGASSGHDRSHARTAAPPQSLTAQLMGTPQGSWGKWRPA